MNPLQRHYVYLLSLLCLISFGSRGQSKNEKQECFSFASDSIFRHGTLKNGFTYYLLKNDDPKQEIQMELVVKAGRTHENEDQLEYAHLIEHLSAGKTRNFPDVHKFIKEVGGYSNAVTSARFTNYYARIPAGTKKAIDRSLLLLKDWAQGNEWSPKDIEKQSAAIMGEGRTFDFYQKWIGEKMKEKVLEGTGYKFYPNSKRFKNLEEFKLNAFNQYYKTWYRPDLEAAIIVGNIELDSTQKKIEQLFSNLRTPEKRVNADYYLVKNKIRLDGKNHFYTVIDSTDRKSMVKIIHSWRNFDKPESIEDYRMMLLQSLYTMMINSRGIQLMQQFTPPFSGFAAKYGVNLLPDRQLAAFSMEISLGAEDSKSQKTQFQEGVIAWKQMNMEFTDEELAMAKKRVLSIYKNDELRDNASKATRLKEYFVYNKCFPNTEEEVSVVLSVLQKIQLSDLADFAKTKGNIAKNTNFIFFKSGKEEVPNHETIQQWIDEVDTMSINPWERKMSIKTLKNQTKVFQSEVADLPNIEENMIGVSSFHLPNGVKILLKPTKPRQTFFKNKVYISAFRSNQVPLENRKEYLTAIVAPEVLEYLGVGGYNKFQIDRFKREKEIKLRFEMDYKSQQIYAESSVHDLPDLLDLFYLYLKKPGKDQKGFELWKVKKKEQLKGKDIRGSKEFLMEKFKHVWYPQLPELEIEDLDDLKLDQILSNLDKWYSGIDNFTFIVTGDFDKEKVSALLANTLSTFPTDENHSISIKDPFKFPLQKIEKNLEYKNINQVFTSLYFPIKVSHNLKTQLELRILSYALHKKIYDRLRDGCYSPYARGAWMDYKNNIYAFQIHFDSNLGNEKRMRTAALEEFRKLRDQGVDEQWFKTTVSNELLFYEGRFESFGYFNFWPEYLQNKEENKENSIPEVLEYGTLLEYFINLEDINEAAKKYLKDDCFQQFTGYPEGYCN
ncbi:hypothetical protein C7S20_02600 [Christiangramia fulva]|uniref:Peptidase M16 n=1 Tax=Christiangramia fulva TaxID=2126553 RepID=A0A2R3Z1X1_9FLAO|nr:insulinase family protein [Christiangramia fulva]AVR44239.1 hypothetical protein C7S20_02600 [Christiangramia fulva]